MHSAKDAPDAIVCANGYKLMMIKSKGSIPKSLIADICSELL